MAVCQLFVFVPSAYKELGGLMCCQVDFRLFHHHPFKKISERGLRLQAGLVQPNGQIMRRLDKCSSFYRSYKASHRVITIHALVYFLFRLKQKSNAFHMKNTHPLLQRKADQYMDLSKLVYAEIEKQAQ